MLRAQELKSDFQTYLRKQPGAWFIPTVLEKYALDTDAEAIYIQKYYFIVYSDQSWLSVNQFGEYVIDGDNFKLNGNFEKIELKNKLPCFNCMWQGPRFIACDAHQSVESEQ